MSLKNLLDLLRPLTFLFNRHRRLFLWIGGFLLIGLFYFMFAQSSSSEKKVSARFVPVQKDTLFQTLTLSGTVHSSKALELLAPMEWRYDLQIVYLVPEGTQAQPGDTLLKFNTSKLQVELESARRELQTQRVNLRELLLNQKMQTRQLENQLTFAKLNLEDAKLNLQKARFESDVMQKQAEIALKQADIQLQRAKDALKNSSVSQQAARIKAEMAVQNARAEVNALETQIRRFSLVSPHAGMVVYGEAWFGNGFRKIHLGDKVHAGDALIELPDLHAMESRILMNEVDVHKVHPGQRALLWLEARPSYTYHGVVKEVAQISEPENFARGQWWEIPSSVRVFRGKVAISDPDSSLKPGMTIKTRIFLDTIPNVLLVPAEALAEKDGKPVVFTPDGPQHIQLGPRNSTRVVVRAGLREKDKIQLPLPPNAQPFGQNTFYASHLQAIDLLSTALKNVSFDTTAQAKPPGKIKKDSSRAKIKAFLKSQLYGKAGRHVVLPSIKKGKQ